MKFVADEGVDSSLVRLLRAAEHDVFYFAEHESGTADEMILDLANKEHRILITRDKDFGELVYRMKQVHAGIILIRLEQFKSKTRAIIVAEFIKDNLGQLTNRYIVLQPGAARLRDI